MRKSKPPSDFAKRPSQYPKRPSAAPRRAGALAKGGSVPRIPTAKVPSINADDDDTAQTTQTRNLTTPVALDDLPPETLTVLKGPDEGKVYPLPCGDVWIGRGNDCDIIIVDKGLSRSHACFNVTEGTVTLRDNQSKNGTFVNHERVEERTLAAGDEIKLGSNVCLLFSRSRLLAERFERSARDNADSIASIVAGLAHEINTPLGVANTANAIIEALAEEVRRNPKSERVEELLADLRASAGLVSKNLERTNALVRLFKQLSTHEAVEERTACDLASVLTECVDAIRKDTDRRSVKVRTEWDDDADYTWSGFQGSMFKVISHLLLNTLRYAYPNHSHGIVDIRLSGSQGKYRIEVEDYGIGVAPHILSKLFQPFVTSARESGATGLGLAVVRNIVTNRFGGSIKCTSRVGKGTKFVIVIPRVSPTQPLAEL
jgi:signal transduction histidine kinase